MEMNYDENVLSISAAENDAKDLTVLRSWLIFSRALGHPAARAGAQCQNLAWN